MQQRMAPIPPPTISERRGSSSISRASIVCSSEMTQHVGPAPFARSSFAMELALFCAGGICFTNRPSNQAGFGCARESVIFFRRFGCARSSRNLSRLSRTMKARIVRSSGTAIGMANRNYLFLANDARRPTSITPAYQSALSAADPSNPRRPTSTRSRNRWLRSHLRGGHCPLPSSRQTGDELQRRWSAR
jgi:hypothetical protein